MSDTVDTSKEAVMYAPELHADKFDSSAGEYMVSWETHVALLAERDQLRREVEEARDKALEEAALMAEECKPDRPLQARAKASQIADEIRALKARP